MKKLLSIFLFAFLGKTNAQFYEKSFYTSYQGIIGVAQGLANSREWVDRKGNIFLVEGWDPCMGCMYQYKIRKQNYYTNNTWFYNFPIGIYPSYNTDFFPLEDQNGNTYFFWRTETYTPGYDVSGGYAFALFKFNQANALQWIIDTRMGEVFTDINDNISVLDSSYILRRYSPAGLLTDSVPFNASTKPMFMDSLGFYYRYTPGSLTKFDIGSNIIWQKNLPFNTVNYSMQGENIFAYSVDSIYLINLNGNHVAYYNYAQSQSGLRFDLNGFYYNSSSKYNFSGLVHQQCVSGFDFMDRTGRTYKFGFAEFPNGSNIFYNLVVPPSLIRTFGPYGTVNQPSPYGVDLNWCQVFNPDETERNIEFTIQNWQINFCTSNSTKLTFEVSKYPASLLTNGFDVELSDATGSFSSPVLIGHGISSPISIYIPDTMQPGFNYSIRIIPLDSSYTYTGNVINNARIHVSPNLQFVYSDVLEKIYTSGNNSYLNVVICDSNIISCNTNAIDPVYKWKQIIGLSTPIEYVRSTTDSVNSASLATDYYLSLTVTDSVGCYKSDSLYPTVIDNPPYFWQPLTDSVNIVSLPIGIARPQIIHYLRIDTIIGNGVTTINNGGYTTSYFYPDSAGPGWHYITYFIKPNNIVGDLPCIDEIHVDSIFVSTNAFATISGVSRPQICSGDSITVFLGFAGDPPFTFSLLQNGTVYGPYTTFGNNYSIVVYPTTSGSFIFQSFGDASAYYTSNAWQNGGYVQVLNYTAPTLTFTGNLSFCAGDSVQLIRNNAYANFTYSWRRNGVTISGVTGLDYYAKTQGVYQAGFVSNTTPACTRLSNPVTVTVPCITHTGGGNSPLKTYFNDNESADAVFYQSGNNVILKPNFSSVLKVVELYDLNGKRLLLNAAISDDGTITVALPVLSSSVYFMTYIFEDRVVKEKVMKGR